MIEVKLQIVGEMPLTCRDCDYEISCIGECECLFTKEVVTDFKCRGNKCPLKLKEISVKDLKEEDKKLIIGSMIETSVSRISEAQMYRTEMSKKSYEKSMNESERLVYLINVLNGVMEYK